MNIIIGRKPVLEAINSGEEIEQVYILFGQQGGIIKAITVAAKKRGIKVNQIPIVRFKEFSDDKNTQGVLAIKPQFKYSTLEEIIEKTKNKKALSLGEGLGEAFPLLLALDEIQDPHNLGAILRSAECSGVDGVILTKHNSASINSTVVKTSAGATEHLMICQVNNLANTLDELKKENFWIVGSSLNDAKDYSEVDYKIPMVLVVGNEEKGIRRLTAEKCDFLINIPMKGKLQSLNVSVASGILLFEIIHNRQLS